MYTARNLFLVACLATAPVYGVDWALDGENSRLSFVTVKNVDIAEAHQFGGLKGSVSGEGQINLQIVLDSIDTKIPIRDERIREHVLGTAEFPLARVTGQVDWSAVGELGVGQSLSTEIRIEFEFRGSKTPFLTQVQVSAVDENILQAVSSSPVLVNARTLGVAEGVEKLREIAGLTSISMAVPVYFSLRFERRP